MTYKINIDEQEFNLQSSDLDRLNLIETGENKFHLLQDNQAYHISVLDTDFANKSLTLSINGNEYQLQIADEYDQLVEKLGMNVSNSNKLTDVKAPMPGLIVDVLVKPGQEVKKGDQILILEAMKMENVLKAEGEGVVKSVAIKKGAAVDKGQVLIEME